MNKTMTGYELAALSEIEDRTVTEYPETSAEEESILNELRSRDDYCDETEHSGCGYEGAEARGWVAIWGQTWRVDVIRAPNRRV